MKKIPSLFVRNFEDHEIKSITTEVTKGCEWVLNGEGIATKKFDGTCCLIKDNKIFARFDFKPGRKLPEGAIPCQKEADEITGHFPHWVEVKEQPQYKYHKIAFEKQCDLEEGTYELCGPHFNNNPEKYEEDVLIKHASVILEDVPRTFDGIKEYLQNNYMEGIVFHRGNGEMCKIKRKDFGFPWNK